MIDACPPGGGGAVELAIRDSITGKAVDFEELRLDDAVVFHDVNGTIDGKLATLMDKHPGEVFDAHVWFRVDLSDAPDKEEEVGSATLTAQQAVKRETRTRLAAHAAAQAVASIPELEGVTKVWQPTEYGIPVLRVRGTVGALHQIGKLPSVWRVMLDSDAAKTHSADFYCTTRTSNIDPLGFDGSGQKVAILERGSPDSYLNLTNAVSDAGGCLPAPAFGTARKKCHCPSGNVSDHSRVMAGVVANSSTSFGGLADQATLLFANWEGCTSNGPDQFTSALNWATANGARIISRSEGWPVPWEIPDDRSQTSRDFLIDYKISVSPYPFFAQSTGNDPNYHVSNALRNGIVVGGGNETSGCDRTAVSFASTSYQNLLGAQGLEVPHLVAIAANADTAGDDLGEVVLTGGSSAATAEVAATVASLHEANAALTSWPEVVVPGLMATADEDVDGVQLDLLDNWDDRDGAGLLNAHAAYLTLAASSKVNGGNPPSSRGHDYGTISPGTTPAGTPYTEVWNAVVGSGHALRVAALLQSRPNCPSNPGCNEPVGGCGAASICSANPYVIFTLEIWDGSTFVALSVNSNTSYQFVRYLNTSGVTKTYQIKITPHNYGGLATTTWGVAWHEE